MAIGHSHGNSFRLPLRPRRLRDRYDRYLNLSLAHIPIDLFSVVIIEEIKCLMTFLAITWNQGFSSSKNAAMHCYADLCREKPAFEHHQEPDVGALVVPNNQLDLGIEATVSRNSGHWVSKA